MAGFGIALRGLGMLGKKKASKTIKSVKPLSNTGGKTVEQVKQGAAKSKLDSAKFNLKQTFKESDRVLDKLKNTIKKREPKMGGGMMGRQMYKSGKLVGGQKKLDKDGDGKISGNDFSIIKKMKDKQ